MPRSPRALAVTAAAIALACLSGCRADGAYLVRGTVRALRDDGAAEPLRDASVTVRPCEGDASRSARTAADGGYQIQCAASGMLPLFAPFGGGVPDADVEVAASGHPPRSVKLLYGTERDVTRAAPDHRIYRVDFLLDPTGPLSTPR